MADQSALLIQSQDGSGDYEDGQRVLTSSDTLVLVAAVTANLDITLAANKALKGAGALTIDTAAGADLTLDPAGDLIVSLSDDAGSSSLLVKDSGGTTIASINSDGDLVLAGGVTFNGDNHTIQGTTVEYEDSLLLLAKDVAGAPSLDGGFIVERGTSQNVGFFWDESADQWVFALTDDTGSTGTVTIADYANVRLGGLAVDDTMTVGGSSTFTSAADFDAGITLAASQSITGDGALSIESGGAGSINLIPANNLNVTFADSAGAKKVSFIDQAITEVASINSDGEAAFKALTLASGAQVTSILDEDDLSSDSATALATQQSIKAYIDAQVADGPVADGSEQLFAGYTVAGTAPAAASLLFGLVNESGNLRAAVLDVTDTAAKARCAGVYRNSSNTTAALSGRCNSVLVEDNVSLAIGDQLVASANTNGRVTKMGATGAPAAGEYKVVVGWCESVVTGGTDQVAKANLQIQPPVLL